MTKYKTQSEEDLQVVALLVAKRLRKDRASESAPALGDFGIATENSRYFDRAHIRLNVDLGRGASIRIDDTWGTDECRDTDDLVSTADDMADLAIKVLDQAADIRAMLADVRRTAKREVAKASRRGLRCRLVAVSLCPMEVHSYDDIMVDVEIEILGRSLQPIVAGFNADCGQEVADEFARIQDEQMMRAQKRADLDRKGASGLIDAVVVAAMRDADADTGDILSRLAREEWIVDVEVPGDRSFHLHWDEGTVFANVSLGEGINWREGRIDFARTPFAIDDSVKGRRLADLFPHPLIADDVIVRSGYGVEGGSGVLKCEVPILHFAAGSGKIWAS